MNASTDQSVFRNFFLRKRGGREKRQEEEEKTEKEETFRNFCIMLKKIKKKKKKKREISLERQWRSSTCFVSQLPDTLPAPLPRTSHRPCVFRTRGEAFRTALISGKWLHSTLEGLHSLKTQLLRSTTPAGLRGSSFCSSPAKWGSASLANRCPWKQTLLVVLHWNSNDSLFFGSFFFSIWFS